MRKTISVVLALTLVLSLAIPAFGAEQDSKALEKAILAVKKVVDIPQDYNLIRNDSYEYDDAKNTKGVIWSLQWENEKEEAGIYASVDWLGNLLYFSHDKYRSQDEGLAKVNRNQALAAADAFLAKAMPELADNMKPVKENQTTAEYDRYNFSYTLHSGNIPVSFVNASVAVNKYTGEVNYFQGLSEGQTAPKLPAVDPGSSIDSEMAKGAYLEQIGTKMVYFSDYDYRTKTLKVFAGYRPDPGNTAIDAITGKKVELEAENFTYWRDAGGAAYAKEQGNYDFSPKEMAALDEVKGLIDKEGALRAAQKAFPSIDSSQKLIHAQLSKNMIDKTEYTWSLSWDEAYAEVNAQNGELISAWKYIDGNNGANRISEEKAKGIAESFLKGISAEKFGACAYESSPQALVEENGQYTFRYVRQVNGIDFVNNGMNVTVSAKDGTILSYSRTWYSSVEFPSLDGAITAEVAFNAMDKAGEYALVYKEAKDGKPILIYDFLTSITGYYFDYKTGTMVDYAGKPARIQVVPEYTDLQGHWSQKTVEALKENGYYLDGDKFNPNQSISQIDFLKYLFTPSRGYYTDEDFMEMLKGTGILKEGETATAALIQRQDAVKYAVRYLGLGKAAELSGIYNSVFKDSVGEAYKGYAAIAYGLGIVKGDAKGNFNGSKGMTNAEAATLIYNLLQV